MKKALILSVIGLISLATWSLSTDNTDNGDELGKANVEALTQNEYYDPNISYGYELNPCYKEYVLKGQKVKRESGARCMPTNPFGECRRSWQWGEC